MEHVGAKPLGQVRVNKRIKHAIVQCSLSPDNQDDGMAGSFEEFRLSIIALLECFVVVRVEVVDSLREGVRSIGRTAMDLSENLDMVGDGFWDWKCTLGLGPKVDGHDSRE